MSAGSAELRLGRQVATVAAVALVAVLYAVHAALPVTPFGLPFDDRQTVRTFVPQGWAFFTKSPRSPEPTVYGYDPDGSWRTLSFGPQATPGNLMGLDRLGRSQGTELAIILNRLPAKAWSNCDQQPVDCLSGLQPRYTVVNYSTHRSICGDVGVSVQEVLPWAWRNLPAVMPSKVARMTVAC
jgi:antimicrobial peptide system SdpA family protein